MEYLSTRDTRESPEPVSAAEAIRTGLSADGGLYAPADLPRVEPGELEEMKGLDYGGRVLTILRRFLSDYGREELEDYIGRAYNPENFQSPEIAPLRRVHGRLFFLELWHGPTAAFKDMALQLMPHLLLGARRKLNEDRETVILAATSGDTGKAALEGFRDLPGIRVIVFYPERGVSPIQKWQMMTQEGGNVAVVAVRGNFDDAQSRVKEIFSDTLFARSLKERGYALSSANSINWGRLVPQICYYFSAYADLLRSGELEVGGEINIAVPTGNFGNILAAYYALRMGLPIHRLICASNENNVLTEFIARGRYDRKRRFRKTISPSMDILVSSNLERLLFDLTGRDARKVRAWMYGLSHRGEYRIGRSLTQRLQRLFWGEYVTEGETLEAIRETYEAHGYLMDPHTAVGRTALMKYRMQTGDKRRAVVASTASPFKFCGSVVRALRGEGAVMGRDELELVGELSTITGLNAPRCLLGLKERPVRHDRVADSDEMRDMVGKILGTADTLRAGRER